MSEHLSPAAQSVQRFLETESTWVVVHDQREAIRTEALVLLTRSKTLNEKTVYANLHALQVRSRGRLFFETKQEQIAYAEKQVHKACEIDGRRGTIEGVTITGHIKVRFSDGVKPSLKTYNLKTVTILADEEKP